MLNAVLFLGGLVLLLLGDTCLVGLLFGFPIEEIGVSFLLFGGGFLMAAGCLPDQFEAGELLYTSLEESRRVAKLSKRYWRTVVTPLWFAGTVGYTLTALSGEAGRYFLLLPFLSFGLSLLSTGPIAGGGDYPGAFLVQRLLIRMLPRGKK